MNLKYILQVLFCFLLCFLYGCQSEDIQTTDHTIQVEILEDGRLRIPISLQVPEREVVATKGTSASASEAAIHNAYVMVFDQGGAEQVIACVPATVDPSNTQKIYAVLQPYNRPCYIHVFANLSSANIDQLTQATSLDDIRHLIAIHQQLEDGLLPLSSARIGVSAINATSVNQLSVTLHFGYARIDVRNTVSDFVLQTCQLINVSQEGFLIEHAGLTPDMGGEVSASVRQVSGNTISGLYLFENSGANESDVQGSNPTDLLIKGKKGNNTEGYYKVRLSYLSQGATSYDINRGVRYDMTLKEVKGIGYATAAEAIANEPSNVLFDIYVEDNISKNIVTTNGAYYLGVSNSEFILFADYAVGVTVFTLSHNTPATVTNQTVSIQGAGITFSSSQSGMVVSADRKQATLMPSNGTVQKIPIKLDFASDAAQQGIISIRLGDLIKEVSIKKRRFIGKEGGNILSPEIDAARMSSLQSLSSRVVINADKSITIIPAEGISKNALVSAEGFIADSQGSVLIAIKREVFNVVYYEKYSDNTYGYYYADKTSTLNNTKTIVEAGYGVAGTVSAQNQVRIGAKAYLSNLIPDNSLLTDYSGAIALINQNSIGAESQLSPLSVYIDNRVTASGYLYPNFAKGIYSSAIMDDGIEKNPFLIRTPKQLQNINTILAYTTNKYFAQDCDIDMSAITVGGMSTFGKAVVGNFMGNYNGNSYFINNLKIVGQTSLALFQSSSGRLSKISMRNSSISGNSNVACLAADNSGTIEQIYITQPKVISNSTTSNSYAAAIAGHNYGTITNCLIEVNTSSMTASIQGSGRGVGAVTGCNHTLSAIVSDICVVDLDSRMSFSAVKGGSIEFVGGVVGKNAGYVINILYLARAPYYQNKYCQPIIGNKGYLSEDNYGVTSGFYLKGSSVNSGNAYDTSVGYNTTSFINTTTITGGLWTKISEYPYPMLKSFNRPLSYPVVY